MGDARGTRTNGWASISVAVQNDGFAVRRAKRRFLDQSGLQDETIGQMAELAGGADTTADAGDRRGREPERAADQRSAPHPASPGNLPRARGDAFARPGAGHFLLRSPRPHRPKPPRCRNRRMPPSAGNTRQFAAFGDDDHDERCAAIFVLSPAATSETLAGNPAPWWPNKDGERCRLRGERSCGESVQAGVSIRFRCLYSSRAGTAPTGCACISRSSRRIAGEAGTGRRIEGHRTTHRLLCDIRFSMDGPAGRLAAHRPRERSRCCTPQRGIPARRPSTHRTRQPELTRCLGTVLQVKNADKVAGPRRS